jgi:hypothetical protein
MNNEYEMMKPDTYFSIFVIWFILMIVLFVVPYYIPASDSDMKNRKPTKQALSHVQKQNDNTKSP